MKRWNILMGLQFIIGALICGIFSGCNQKQAAAPSESVKTGQAAPPVNRLQWNLNTTVDIYRRGNSVNSAWDQYATNALIEFARARAKAIPRGENFTKIIATNSLLAVTAGCNDPLVKYLYVRCYLDNSAETEALTAAWIQDATAMNQSTYPPLRKFYAAFRAMKQYQWANNYPANHPPEVAAINRQMLDNYQALLADSTVPVGEIYDATHEFLAIWEGSAQMYQTYYNCIEPILFNNWPAASESWLIKGEAYLQMGWQARGTGFANEVAQDKWKQFKDKLAIAETAAKQAWALDPSNAAVATLMIKLDVGLQRDRADMEMWFKRVMDLTPDNYDACKCKLNYLYPQWYGSRADMLAFGRVCVANTNWGGYVPIILVDAHSDYNRIATTNEVVRLAYWKKPDVWPDLKSSYERFFQLNPDQTEIYKNYAWYAYQAGQWAEFLRIAEKVRPEDYDFFGDKAAFPQMLKKAKANVAESGTNK